MSEWVKIILSVISLLVVLTVYVCGFLWFILNITLKNYYTKREADQLFVQQRECTTNHSFNNTQITEIKADIKEMKNDIKDLLKTVARFFGHERNPDEKEPS